MKERTDGGRMNQKEEKPEDIGAAKEKLSERVGELVKTV